MSDPKARRTVPFRGGGFAPQSRPWISWLTLIVVLGAWQGAVSGGLISPIFLPSPWTVVLALKSLIISGELWRHLAASLSRIGLGWGLGTMAGIVVGVLMGLFTSFRSGGIPMVSALYPIPKIALLPLFILWFGIGETPKVVTIGFGVFFATVIATFTGVDGVPRNLIRMGQSFGMPMFDIVRKILLPGALPGILAGFRISASTALLLVVSAEMVGAQLGIGSFVLSAGNLMQTDQLLAGVAMLSVLGLMIGLLLSRLEKWLLRWR